MGNRIDQEVAVNTSQIRAGDVVKNYGAMCLRLGESQLGGSPQKRQIENWKRYFKFDKKGHKFVIIEVFKEPIPKVNLRSVGNNSSYSKYTPLLLIDWLVRYVLDEMSQYDDIEEVDAIDLYNKDFQEILGLCNENFTGYDDEPLSELDAENIIRNSDKDNFYQRAKTQFKYVIESTLKNIAKKYDSIEVKKTYTASEVIEGEKTNQRTATDEEVVVIEEVNKDTLRRFDAKSMFTIYSQHREKAFYITRNELLKERINLTNAYKVYKLKIIGDIDKLKTEYVLTEEKRNEYIYIVNNLIHEYLDKQAENEFNKNNGNYEEYKAKLETEKAVKALEVKTKVAKKSKSGFVPPTSIAIIPEYGSKIYRNHDNYVKNQRFLSELLIRII